MRVVTILAAYNEQRFIGGCLDHLVNQGVEAYLIDNESTDRTVEIAERYLGRGLIGIETLPRVGGVHSWSRILRRKEEVAATLEADWFMHADPDEIRLPPRPNQTLAEAFAEVDAQGYNTINFVEFTFIPTRESPEHDHPRFMQTMKWYYPFMRRLPYRENAWKRQPEPVNLVSSGGHRVQFPELCQYPEPFRMKHYQFLSLEQARVKYLRNKRYDAAEKVGKSWRGRLIVESMQLPSESELSHYTSDDDLSLATPRIHHFIEGWALPKGENGNSAPSSGMDGLDLPPGATDTKGVATGSGRLIIAGFHRSGTSLVAQLLDRSGMFLGYDLLQQNLSNRHGHLEDREVVNLHDEILANNGLTWQVDGSEMPIVGELNRRRMHEIVEKRSAGHALWGFKDPRACLFLEDWKAQLPDAKVLLVYRHFADATQSLHRRAAGGLLNKTGDPAYHRALREVPDLALRMWLAHNKVLLSFARAHPDDVLAVSQYMLARGIPLVEVLNARWGFGLAETPIAEVFDAGATAERDGEQPVADEGLVGELIQAWEELERLGSRTAELARPEGWYAPPGRRATREEFRVEPDKYALLMENEFLSYEVDFLRGSLVEQERAQRQQGRRRKQSEKKVEKGADPHRTRKPNPEEPMLGRNEEFVIIYPQSGASFYEMLGRRLEAACEEISVGATAVSAEEILGMAEDRLSGAAVAVVQPHQCYFGLNDKQKFSRTVSRAAKKIAVTAESVETVYFENQVKVPVQFDALLDVGFVSQKEKLGRQGDFEVPYRLLMHGPTGAERQRIEQVSASGKEIPWATVGHDRPGRSKLARDLMQSFDPGGVVFLPPEGILVSQERGMIGPSGLDALLQKTRFYVWQSLHDFAYYESFRFREAVLAGAVPCKIDATAGSWGADGIPGVFRSVESFVDTVRELGFEAMRESAKEFYLSQGLFSDHLKKVLHGA